MVDYIACFDQPFLNLLALQLLFQQIAVFSPATAILEMRLYKLIGLEIEALISEHEDTMANIYRYEDILRFFRLRQGSHIHQELADIRADHGVGYLGDDKICPAALRLYP